jgi:2-C-methyl-D-erythritol 4-phosphate cytidylyltransferase/2-C-methyl-D-erythritol 2,4-cyclodiphosphate synthase
LKALVSSEPYIAVIVTAAGRSERFGGTKKELLSLDGISVLERSLLPFLKQSRLLALTITAPSGREDELAAGISESTRAALTERLGPRFMIVPGGAARRDSVRMGLEALAAALAALPDIAPDAAAPDTVAADRISYEDCIVLIHDAARPWASSDLVSRVARMAMERGACVPVLSLVDTPKELGSDGLVVGHPRRSSLGAAQTPQGFRFEPMLEAHRRAHREALECTDDAELWARYIGPVAWIEGESANRKITFREDLPEKSDRAEGGSGDGGTGMGADEDRESLERSNPLSRARAGALPFRVGLGWDLHRLVAGRPLLLGGVALPSEVGEDAHSDGDVLIHAVIDALLGAAALGDIGTHFPPSGEAWKDADSRDLLARAVALVRNAHWEPGNLDCTVVLERPKILPYKNAIRESLASCLGMDGSNISVKAKTAEGLGDIGAARAVEAQAVVTLFPLHPSR